MSETLEDLLLDDDGGLIVRHVVVAEVISPDGSETFRWCASEGVADWTALGLLDYAATVIRDRVSYGEVED